ncbi:MAG: DNA polymerase I [Myxococcota bacterium]|nr:DNA polymerase I [Myxococcota bacterium]
MPRKLFLVDGSNLAFRAYHGIRADLRAPDGFPTRALYGFARILLKLHRDLEPDYIAVAFDVGKSFRNGLFPDYKGQRPDMPPDLREQWSEFPPLCKAFGYRALTLEGFEADDLIGTLANQYVSDEVHVVIVSGDKDFCQLVEDRVHLFDPQNDRDFGPAEVVDRWGVPANRVVDLLALMGDKSDNVPGVPGVGQKKAARFLESFGSIEGVVAHASDIGGKTGERIAEHGQFVLTTGKDLVTIRTDIELDLALSDLAPLEPDPEVLGACLTRFGFQRLADDLGVGGGTGSAKTALDRSGYRLVHSDEDLRKLARDLRSAKCFAFDTETTSLDPLQGRLVGMSFCWGEEESTEQAVYVPIAHDEGPNCTVALEVLGPLLADPTLGKVGQNLKYDLQVLRTAGLDLRGIVGDTMIADYLLHVDKKHGLDSLAERHLGHTMISYKEATADYDGHFEKVPVEQACVYAAEDAHATWRIHQGQDCGPLEDLYRHIELPLIPVLVDMERNGIGVDVASLESLSVELAGRIAEKVEIIHGLVGRDFNINSTQQLARILFEERGHKPGKKTKSGYSTNAAALQQLATSDDPLPSEVLAYRELAKLKSTYVDALPRCVGEDGRIHTSFHQAVAATGRLSSNNPNLQNIPIRTDEGRRIRSCFVPRPGHRFVSADYSQVELRVLAHYCGDGPLLESFLEGQDIHRRTASEIFGVHPGFVTPDQRRAAKAINFGIVYGMSAFRLSRELRIPRREAQAYIDGYFERYPQVRAYMDARRSEAAERGYAETLWGRRRPISIANARSFAERGAQERIAINTPIQGSAADLVKIAMVRVHGRLAREAPEGRLLLQVHDELVLEVPEAQVEAVSAIVIDEMRSAGNAYGVQLCVPLVVDTGSGESWNAAH